MNRDITITNSLPTSINDLKELKLNFSYTNGSLNLVIIDENIEVKTVLKNIVNTYFKDKAKALELFLTFKKKFIKQVLEISTFSKEIIDEIEDLFVEAVWILEDEPQDSFEYVHDQVVSLASILNSKIYYYLLAKNTSELLWLDNRDFVITDDTYGLAKINLDLSKSKWKKVLESIPKNTKVVIIQNKLGSTLDNNTSLISDGENIQSIFK